MNQETDRATGGEPDRIGGGIPVTGVSELALEVRDLAAAERFYSVVLGLPVVERWPKATWVLAGERTRIGLWLPFVGLAGGRGGVHVHFALHLAPEDFEAGLSRLRSHGHAPQVEHFEGYDGSQAAYVTDPDGHVVELWTWDVGRHRMG